MSEDTPDSESTQDNKPIVVSCFRPHPPGLDDATFKLMGESKAFTIKEMVQYTDLYQAVIKWNHYYESDMEKQRGKLRKCEGNKSGCSNLASNQVIPFIV